MKVLEILFSDFLVQLPDEISLQPSPHQILVQEKKKLHSSNKEANRGEQNYVFPLILGRCSQNIISHSSNAKNSFYLFGISPFFFFYYVAGESEQ